jgi:hypothetical protein
MMKRIAELSKWTAVALIVAAAGLTGCQPAEEEPANGEAETEAAEDDGAAEGS